MIRDQELAGLAMTLGRDAGIKIMVGGDGSFCKPDGSHINITRMLATSFARMLMTGLAFHEIDHVTPRTGFAASRASSPTASTSSGAGGEGAQQGERYAEQEAAHQKRNLRPPS